MTLRNLAILFTVALPTAAFARPEPKLTASVVDRACERTPSCMAPLYADLLTGQSPERELRVDGVAQFDTNTVRLVSADRERLARLAAEWNASSSWSVITVEGYADPRIRSGSDRLALAQQRAEKVRDALILAGVSPGLVTAIGHASKPASSGQVDLTIELTDEAPVLTSSVDL